MSSRRSRMQLRELCSDIDYGLTASASDVPIGPRFLRITDIVPGPVRWGSVPHVPATDEQRLKFALRSGDIVIARTGATTGHSAWLAEPPDAVFASYLVRFRVRPEHNSQFVGYLLKGPQWWRYVRAVLGDKSAQPNASARTLADAWLDVPDRATQDAIADLLGALDDKVSADLNLIRKLEALRDAQFRAWFVKSTPDIDLGEIGISAGQAPDEEWVSTDLGAVLTETSERVGSREVPEYSSTNNGLYPRSERFKKALATSASKNKYIRQGDLVFGLSRQVLNFGLMRDEAGSVSAAYRVFAVNEEKLSADILERLIRAQMAHFFQAVSASSREGQSVSPDALLRLKIALPPCSVQRAFESSDGPLREQAKAVQHEIRRLTDLRDTLLPALLSGDVEVRDVDQFVGGTV